LSKIRSIAAAQHEIVVTLIGKKEFAKAAEEANKIFQLKWPADQEPVLLEELLRFSDQFRHNSQPAVALRLLEGNMGFFKANKSKVAIWKDMGYSAAGHGTGRQGDRVLQRGDTPGGETSRQKTSVGQRRSRRR